MSIDTYFCFCCLSTNELSSLFSDDSAKNYGNLLKELFCIKLSQEYEDDSYICDECCVRLKDAEEFKTKVHDTLNILKVNGLIDLRKTKSEFVVKKVSAEVDVEAKAADVADSKNDIESVFIEVDVEPDKKPQETETRKIKREIDFTKLENVEIENSEVIKQFLNNDAVALLKDKFEPRINKIKKKAESYEVTKDLKCGVCGKEMPNLYMYHKHMNGHYPNHVCDVCGKGYLTEQRLKRHLLSHNKGPFTCEICKAEFTNFNSFNGHRQRVHSSVPRYRCPVCGQRFGTFPQRALHLANEHPDAEPPRRHPCPVCRRSFLVSSNLSVHMRRKHLKVKRHFCNECDAAFFLKQDLIGHTAIHTGQKQFHCNMCSKSYPRKKALIVHLRTHNNEKPFCCDICGKKFTQKCTLLIHIKTHEAKKYKANFKPEIDSQITLNAENLETTAVSLREVEGGKRIRDKNRKKKRSKGDEQENEMFNCYKLFY